MKYRKLDEESEILISEEPQSSRNPPVIKIKGKNHYRFMDCLYAPGRISQLPIELVKKLNDKRDEFFATIADNEYNREVYRSLTARAKKEVVSPGTILDFGCGLGHAGKHIRSTFPDSKLIGVDIRSAHLNENYNKIIQINPDESMPFPDDFFDLCFSFFVFHFPIYEKQLQELSRVICEGGLIAFNMINSTDISIIDRIDSIGFDVIDSIEIETKQNFGRAVFFQKRSATAGVIH